jgi:Cu(I)/Ag(I) efflux system membrane fusion protein
MVNITHEPAEAWDWPEMTMDFTVAQSVDVKSLKPGQSLHFEVTKKSEGQHEVTGIRIMDEPMEDNEDTSTATVAGAINVIDKENRILNISRDPIKKWNRPAATMDFLVTENIDIVDFNTGDEVIFTFEVRDDLIITEISHGKGEQHNNLVDHSNH